MVNQVGRPAMFEGKRFLPETGTPIWKMARRRVVFAVWLPDPFTVATWMLKLLTFAKHSSFQSFCCVGWAARSISFSDGRAGRSRSHRVPANSRIRHSLDAR